jgi:hypothetical protein
VLPTITITCPASPQIVGVPGAFTVTPATTAAFPIQNVTVDLGDGDTRNLGQITGPTSFTKAYASEGGFTVTATVTDTNGQRGSSSCAVVVTRSQPTVTLTGPSNLAPGASGTFEVGATAQAGTSIRNVRVVDTNDGRELYNSTSGGAFTASFITPGAHTLRATATDSAGGTGSTTKVVNVP